MMSSNSDLFQFYVHSVLVLEWNVISTVQNYVDIKNMSCNYMCSEYHWTQSNWCTYVESMPIFSLNLTYDLFWPPCVDYSLFTPPLTSPILSSHPLILPYQHMSILHMNISPNPHSTTWRHHPILIFPVY